MESMIARRYLHRSGGDRTRAAAARARDLMRGDASTLKAGYSVANAALAARDLFGLSDREHFALLDHLAEAA